MVDTSRICPYCMHSDALADGKCRFCGKHSGETIPIGVLPPGTVLNGRYLTGMFLGIGGYGITYRALDLNSNKMVAIKEYRPKLFCERFDGSTSIQIKKPDEFQYGLAHFRSEAEILESLQGIPEIVRIYHDFAENNTAYYVMEFLDGETLQSFLKKRNNKLSFPETVKLLLPVILALDTVHRAGTLHRDISPDNIFVCRDGAVKLIDFGASRVKIGQYENSFMPVEKEGYSPPEQHTIDKAGTNQGPWSDVYAMAGTIYRCVTGKRPTPASARLAGDPLETPGGVGSGLSDIQAYSLEKNLALNPKERCQTMLDFAGELVVSLRSKDSAELLARYPALNQKTEPIQSAASLKGKRRASQNQLSSDRSKSFFSRIASFFKKDDSKDNTSVSPPLNSDSKSGSGAVLSMKAGQYQGSTLHLKPGKYTFGRNPDQCNIVYPMDYTNVSRVHFYLTLDTEGRLYITDVSTYGTWLNQTKLEKNVSVPVKYGDIISFGNNQERILIGSN